MKEVAVAFFDVMKKNPKDLINLLIVGGFLYYLHSQNGLAVAKEKRDQQLSNLRIEQCHGTQDDMVEVIDKLNRTLDFHTVAFSNLNTSLIKYNHELEEYHKDLDDLSKKLDNLECPVCNQITRKVIIR